jgi:pSer/pThr/pTyr-binding forkhead associated (FHA) protein/type II secretory pathway predicted ATPase ExeA
VRDESHTAFIQYPSQQEAFSFLEGILADDKSLGLLHGPDVAGKSELIEQIAQKVRERAAVAVVDGSHLRPTAFLNAILSQFGYELELTSTEELLKMINVFGVQQAQTREAPVLVLEHFNHMLPSTLKILCQLAQLTNDQHFVIRIILVGDRYFRRVVDSPRMLPISIRLVGDFEMRPLTSKESLVYLFSRLRASGIKRPESTVSAEICNSLHLATGGWPGNLDSIADSIINKRQESPIDLEEFAELESDELFGAFEKVQEDEDVPVLDDFVEPEPPKLVISYNREVVQKAVLNTTRTILGRSVLSDVVIENQYVSKQHAMLVQSEGTLVLVDLKSRNGTLVNSKRVTSQVLRDNDIISLGDFRIKVLLPDDYHQPAVIPDMTDTTKMMTLEDARRARKDEQFRVTEMGEEKNGKNE